MNRRDFPGKSMALGATGLYAPAILNISEVFAGTQAVRDDISIAQWALVEEIRSGQWTTLGFPKIAREVFDINGIEFVNTLFEVPTQGYLNKLKLNAEMIKMSYESGYRGWYGIESSGREEIIKGKKLLQKYLLNK